MGYELRTKGGRSLMLERLDRRQIAVLSPDAWPPGSLVDVECAEGEFVIKVHACRWQAAADAFRIEGLPVNLGRQVREALEVRVAPDY